MEAGVHADCPSTDPSHYFAVVIYTDEDPFDLEAEGRSCLWNTTRQSDEPMFFRGKPVHNGRAYWGVSHMRHEAEEMIAAATQWVDEVRRRLQFDPRFKATGFKPLKALPF